MTNLRTSSSLERAYKVAGPIVSHGFRPIVGRPNTHKHLPDLASTLGSKTLGNITVGQTGNVLVSLFHNDQRERRNVGSNNAAADRLPLPLSGTTGAVARVALGEEQPHTLSREHALLHRETLLVVSSHDFEDVALVFVAKSIPGNFGRDPLVVENTPKGERTSNH